MLDECICYLDATVYNIEMKVTSFEEKNTQFASNDERHDVSAEAGRKLSISSKFQKLRFLTRMHLQLGAVLSQVGSRSPHCA